MCSRISIQVHIFFKEYLIWTFCLTENTVYMIQERSKYTLILIMSSTNGFYIEKHVSIMFWSHFAQIWVQKKIFFEETCSNRIHLFKIMIILNEWINFRSIMKRVEEVHVYVKYLLFFLPALPVRWFRKLIFNKLICLFLWLLCNMLHERILIFWVLLCTWFGFIYYL